MNAIPETLHPFERAHEFLLADIAIRIQLPSFRYHQAIERFETIISFLKREKSPLADLIEDYYPQGSMATNTTISVKEGEDEFDVDLVIQLSARLNLTAKQVLDLIYSTLNGEKGSKYFGKIRRHTRCVTVDYEDNMHIDVVPCFRKKRDPREKVSEFSNYKPEISNQNGSFFIGNPWGFAEWFKNNSKKEGAYSKYYSERTLQFEQGLLRAEGILLKEEIPDQENISEKSIKVISLQLLKRFRDKKYLPRTGKRPVPSVVLSALTVMAPLSRGNLYETLFATATYMRNELTKCQEGGREIEIRNQTCFEDLFTDRWPGTLEAQSLFIDDLNFFLDGLSKLPFESLEKQKEILSKLFGERAAERSILEFADRGGTVMQENKTLHRKADGNIALASSGITAKISSSPTHFNKPGPNTPFGR